MSSESYHITPYHSSDKSECLACFASNIPHYFTVAELSEFKDWLSKFDTDFPVELFAKDIHYHTIRNNDQIVGCGGFGLQPSGREVVFAWGLIHKDFQKQGFGKSLFLFRLDMIRRIYPGLDIVLDTTQHTFAFFEKFGFVTEKITKDFYAAGLDRYDMRMSARGE